MSDNDNNEVDPYGAWADELSDGELRRLQFHLSEANERLQKAYAILDEAGLIDAWSSTYSDAGMKGDHGFIYNVTDAVSRLSDTAPDAQNKYEQRNNEGEQ